MNISLQEYEKLHQRVLYEDNHLLIVNKPAKAIVQGDKTGDEPLVDQYKRYLKRKYDKPGNVFLGVTHRLDRPTSGVVIFAKTSKALSRINDMLRLKKVQKYYWAVTENELKLHQAQLVHYLKRNPKQNKSYAHRKEVANSKKAVLNYRFLLKSNRYYLYEVELITGRHHQIRSQLSFEGSIIKGDLKYGAKTSNPDGSIHLHARKIEFEHPISKKTIQIIAPVPQETLWQFFEKEKLRRFVNLGR